MSYFELTLSKLAAGFSCDLIQKVNIIYIFLSVTFDPRFATKFAPLVVKDLLYMQKCAKELQRQQSNGGPHPAEESILKVTRMLYHGGSFLLCQHILGKNAIWQIW